MAIKSMFKRFVVRGAKLTASEAEQVGRDGRNVDIWLRAALGELGAISKLATPPPTSSFSGAPIEPMACGVEEVRNELSDNDLAARRFATLVEVLGSDVPKIPFGTAQEIALVAEVFYFQSPHRSGERVGFSLPLFASPGGSAAWSWGQCMVCRVCSFFRR